MNKQLSNHNHAQKVAENLELDARDAPVQPPPIVFNIPCLSIQISSTESEPLFYANFMDTNVMK